MASNQMKRRYSWNRWTAFASACALASVVFMPTGAQATFPGKNGHIVFIDWHEDPIQGAGYDLFTVAPDGQGVTQITDLPAGDIYNPKVSPDGRRIVFTYYPWQRSTDELQPSPYERYSGSDLYLVDVDGSNLVRLTKTRKNELMPTWSPDAKKIAFVGRDRSKTRQVFVIAADGSGRRDQLTHMKSDVWAPDWSPRGSRIAFTAFTAAGTSEIFTISARGRKLTRVTHGAVAVAPVWSPDGETLVFHEWRNALAEPNHHVCFKAVGGYGTMGPCELDIYSIRADGRSERRLTDAPGADMTPAWSPDGTKIVFVSDRLGGAPWRNDLWVMNADGSDQQMIVNTPGDIWAPTWQSVQP